MKLDYYRILEVSPAATLDTIRRAYRARVMEHHPDRGGSHEAMIRINEAYAILSDPLRRRTYDAARRTTASAGVRKAADEDVAGARVRAEDYPRDWVDVEPWLSRLVNDFTDARYDEVVVLGGLTMPVVKDSISGFFCIVFGAAAGTMFGTVPLLYAIQESQVRMNVYMILMLGVPVLVGAWAGSHLHRSLGAGLSWARRRRRAGRSRPARDRS